MFLSSIYCAKKGRLSSKKLFIYSFYYFLLIFLSIFFLVANHFTGNGINEAVLYHIVVGLEGAGFSEYWRIILEGISIIIIGIIVFLWVFLNKRKNKGEEIIKWQYYSIVLINIALLFSPTTHTFFDIFKSSFFLNDKETTDFKNYYKPPNLTKASQKDFNLIFIYAESLERTYFDEKLFPGLITGLREIEKNSTYFTNIKQVAGTEWTMGGIVASQCGIPLISTSHRNSMAGLEAFLSGATCLGELLKDAEYKLSYYGGAKLLFAGKGQFLSTHKFDEIYGLKELLPKLPDRSYASSWGLYDDSLFEFAFKDFMQRSQSDQKFATFLLTLDTHHPKGHLSKKCAGQVYKDGSNPILNAVKCSDSLISDFVAKVKNSKYGDKTVIVIASDHLAMRNTAYDLLRKGDRENLFMIVSPSFSEKREIKKVGSTLDIAPTILNVLGYESAVGLGRNLLGEGNSIITEFDRLDDKLKTWKPELLKFWDFPKIRKSILIDYNGLYIKIDKRKYNFPVLINFNEKLETNMWFRFYTEPNQKILTDHINEFEKGEPFLWIDTCDEINKIYPVSWKSDFCMAIGKKDHGDVKVKKLEKTLGISATEILKVVSN